MAICIYSSFALVAVMIISLSDAQNYPIPLPPEGVVSSMCAAAQCPVGKICRVIVCPDSLCVPKAVCLPCVPEGVDEVCNSQDYINAVLVGHKDNTRSLNPLYCNPKLDNNINGCPQGSVCAVSNELEFVGTCCYGKPDPLPVTGDINSDTRCPSYDRCAEKCKDGYECKAKLSDCGIVTYGCQPMVRKGQCPPIGHSNPGFCVRSQVIHRCKIDWDCQGQKKCCKTSCNGMACSPPR